MGVSADGAAGDRSVFRERWRERQSAGNGLERLVRQPAWVDAGLVILGVLLVLGVVAAANVTVARTAAFPAVSDGLRVSAVRDAAPAPLVGSPARFHDLAGTDVDAVVVEVDPTEVIAELSRPTAPSAGQLLVAVGPGRLVDLLAPRPG